MTVQSTRRRLRMTGRAGLLAGGLLLLCGPAAASAEPWFSQAANIPTQSPATNNAGDPTGGAPRNKGGEATAVFDVNHDGVQDIVIVNGTSSYFVALGHRAADGTVSFSDPVAQPIGLTGDGKKSVSKALGLTDFDGDGKLDLYLSNNGQGALGLNDPRDLEHAYDPANLDTTGLSSDNRFRTYFNQGDGSFAYKDIGGDTQGDTRQALFADFDGDGHQDLLSFNAPYFGIWWKGDGAPNSLVAGQAGGTFGKDLLPDAIVDANGNPETHLFADEHGRGNIDIKGAVVRDFDGDGRPDVIASAYADSWDNIGTPPIAPADPRGADIDLDHDGVGDGGYQGAWRHGIIVLRNISTSGHIRFQDVSDASIDQSASLDPARMHVYETIPMDFDHDGDLDLFATGVRNFTAVGSLDNKTPLVQLYRNDSTRGQVKFTNITKDSGVDFMNHDDELSAKTNGRFPISLPGQMQGGGPLIFEPLLSAGAQVDIDNDSLPDVVAIDRQLLSRDPRNNNEFSLWVFHNLGGGHFELIDPTTHGLTHTARDISYGDFNGDGRTDLVTVNGSGGGQSVEDDNYVWLNQLKTNDHWLDVTLSGPSSPLGLGAKVTVLRAGTDQVIGADEMRTDFAYRSKRDARLHFGLGDATLVDVRVQGLGATPTTTIKGVRADQIAALTVPAQGGDVPAPAPIGAPATPAPTPAGPVAAAATRHRAPKVQLSFGTFRLSSSGRATVRLRCPATRERLICKGELLVSRAGKRVATTRYAVPSGTRRAVLVRMPAAVRSTVARKGRTLLRVEVRDQLAGLRTTRTVRSGRLKAAR